MSELESHISDQDSQLHLAQLQVDELQHQLKQVRLTPLFELAILGQQLLEVMMNDE